MKHHTIDKGIIDSIINPFVQQSWIAQGFGFTAKRQKKIENLFGQNFENILMSQPRNDNKYVAFVSIRWGFACLQGRKLAPTEKWFNRKIYDEYGRLLKHNTMENLLDVESITFCTKRSPWSLGNDVLYKMCADNFKHDTAEKIIAKVWLIGRSYAVAIERRKNKTKEIESDKFYTETVVNAFQTPELDKMMDKIKTISKLDSDTLMKSLEVHSYLTKLINKITDLNKRSFSSKYLHFHLPLLFYIYDSRAVKSISQFKIKIPSDLKRQISSTNFDIEYAEFACKCFILTNHVKETFGIELTPRQIDYLLLERIIEEHKNK